MATTITENSGFVFTGDLNAGLSEDQEDHVVRDKVWKLCETIIDRNSKGQHQAAFRHAVDLVNMMAKEHSYAGGAYE